MRNQDQDQRQRTGVSARNLAHGGVFPVVRHHKSLGAQALQDGIILAFLQREKGASKSFSLSLGHIFASHAGSQNPVYPCTLIREKESTARDEIGRPMLIAGRKVVKISIRLTCGRRA